MESHKVILRVMLLDLCFLVLGSAGCGENATPVTSAAAGQVNTYFGGPFNIAGSALARSSSTFDHSTKHVSVTAFISTQTAQVPSPVIDGAFSSADTGFLGITENFATSSSGVVSALTPPLTGAWAVEIPGAGALANLLNLTGSGGALSVSAGPAAMAENTACPNFQNPTPFLYVTVPKTNPGSNAADYGRADISTQGSFVNLDTKPFLVGSIAQAPFSAAGGCSDTNLGALTAYPLNSFASAPDLDLISIGSAGLLVSSYSTVNASGTGAFGGGAGVMGVAEPSAPVDVGAVIGGKYNGFIYAPRDNVPQGYDITVLASAFGDSTATSQACSALQSSLVANNGKGAKTIPVLPSSNSLYGGEFLTTTTSVAVNDPTRANGSENCDVVIDLGTQDPANNGLFPNATVFIGSNYPPFSVSQPWMCAGTQAICAVSFPAAAVVGKVQGRYVIFMVSSAASTPGAQLPDAIGNRQAQPVGIYLFQKSQ